MAVKREREECGDDVDVGEVEYEKLRNERLKENQKRMEELGLLSLSKSLSETVRPPPRTFSSPSPRSITPAGPARRSSRLSGSPVVSYSEVEKKSGGKEKSAGRKASQAGTGGFQPEIYTEEDEKLLGSAKSEWRLFVDGYDSKGVRMYDTVLGKTCHQCRQKTMGHRTSCSNCQSLHGQFCGDCLYMRYGENVIEAKANENWECPVCRGICNCSFCRLKRGWTPTGSLYRKIKSLGYESVAHYLVLTRRGENSAEKKECEEEVKSIEAAELKTPTSAPAAAEDEASEEEQSHPAGDATSAPILKQEKVPEVQSTLLDAGFRSRRSVDAGLRSRTGGKFVKESAKPTIDRKEEVASEHPQPQPKRRGRPPKNQLSGKAAFYGKAPSVAAAADPEPVVNEKSVALVDSDTEVVVNRPTETIAHRLRRRVTT